MFVTCNTDVTMRLLAVDSRDTPPIRKLFPLQLRSFPNLLGGVNNNFEREKLWLTLRNKKISSSSVTKFGI
jgi:hypothetical protein